jgi:osmotically inducible lipoprotein OsmB
MKKLAPIALVLVSALSITACTTTQRAVTGGAAGAAVGGLVAGYPGAIGGAALGVVAGTLIER